MKIEYKTPLRPNDREAKRDAEHRRVAESTEKRFQDNEAFVDALISAITKLGLTGWEPPQRG